MKTLIVGDIHGCLDEFETLMERAGLDLTHDRIILLGDYIDRGPRSCELIQYLRQLQKSYSDKNVVLLRGNHEQMAIDYYEQGNSNWLWNGGRDTLRSFAQQRANIQEAIKFFKTFPLIYTDNHFIYVHAGLRPGVELECQRAEDLLWIREEFYQISYNFGKTVIFGHTPTSNITGQNVPALFEDKIALDTACVYGRYLSALEYQNGAIQQVYQVPAVNNRQYRSA